MDKIFYENINNTGKYYTFLSEEYFNIFYFSEFFQKMKVYRFYFPIQSNKK